ncbi:glycerol-3-phosphate dehydrogenase [Allostella humosa]|nr:glycerol-3-phosphate dehydrogenase [Stella humosa]
MAGLAAAWFLAPSATVTLIEREAALGYHSSGRSAAQFTVGITQPTMRRLAQASRPFFDQPPAGFAPEPLLSPRGSLSVGRAGQEARLHAKHDRLASVGATARHVGRDEALALFPALRPDKVTAGVFEPGAMDIDVDMLLQGYARGARGRGTRIVTDVAIAAIAREGARWVVRTAAESFSAPLLLNAAGAWVDDVTRQAGLAPIGIVPHRRTAFTFAGPAAASGWPHVNTVDHNWYIKPETGRLMGSLADATPTEPCDAWAEDLDVAQAIENIEQDTTFAITRPLSTWAGLRSFLADQEPVAGTRADAPGFFWLAGQGGCGILTSPALGEATAALMLGRELPEGLRALGVTPADLSPGRATLTR